MNVHDSYKVMRLKKGAGMDEVKSAFRKRAFELHPDLHPDDPSAHERFQELNEAYVILKDVLASEPPPKQSSAKAKQKAPPKTDKATGARQYQKQAKTEAKARPAGNKRKQQAPSGPSFTYKKEDVLKNILNDPFARKVFEDIYSQIKDSGAKAKTSPTVVKKKSLALKWGEREMNFDLTGGITGGVKRWMRRQLDDEQTIHLPGNQLIPGNIIRLTISRPWSGEPITVEVPIPADYILGRSLRLRGLGRKIGPVKGDLYLRLMAK